MVKAAPLYAGANLLPTDRGYDRWSAIYDEEANPLIILEEPRVIELLGDVEGLDVADIGCGTGRHALRMARAGARVTALDFSEGMLAKAVEKTGSNRIRFVRHDLERPFPLPDAAFDRVLCALVIDHVSNLASLFAEMGRICRKDGSIVISSMHPAMMLAGVQARFTDPETGENVYPASRPNQLSDYVMAALGAGLTIEHMTEHAVDGALVSKAPRAAKYDGWLLLLLMTLRRVSVS